jgi:hypothetical protein
MNQKVAKITGSGEFPIDMLRYDSCSPYSESDSYLISNTFKNYEKWEIYVKCRPLEKKRSPWTIGRWQSFGVQIEPLDDKSVVFDVIRKEIS